MNMTIHKPAAACAALVLALVSVAGLASPFLGSRSEPHATLYLNVDQRAKQIYPVNIWMVDGKLTNRDDQGMLWITPGEYTFTVKVAKDFNAVVGKPSEIRGVNMADAPGLQRDVHGNQSEHILKVSVEAGKAYYIGAKLGPAGQWEPVVWKTEDEKS